MQLKPLIAAFGLSVLASAASANPDFWKGEWPNTDFTKTNIESWSEILSGGPPKDGIPAIYDPSFISANTETRIGDREPVITIEIEGQTPRAYPIRYMTWHEIVNDLIGDVPIAVTYCPLCNSGIVFDRRLDGDLLTFGVSGKLTKSNLIMYDRESESWWAQAIGLGIVGKYTDKELTQLPSWMESWSEFKTRNPEGLVLDEPNWNRSYGSNPYVSYDSSNRPFLFNGEMPPFNVPALARVVRIGDTAWPVSRIRKGGEITEKGVTISWREGQASALDSRNMNKGKEVGTIRVRDAVTGKDVPHDIIFAFAFHAFFPNGNWMLK